MDLAWKRGDYMEGVLFALDSQVFERGDNTRGIKRCHIFCKPIDSYGPPNAAPKVFHAILPRTKTEDQATCIGAIRH